MGTPYLGQIVAVAFNFAPRGWAFCAGQSMSISGNEALFSLIGTTYGGNGQTTFNLPNLCGRVAIHHGQSSGQSAYFLGQNGGAETVTLTTNQMPQHTHAVMGTSAAATSSDPTSASLLGSAESDFKPYAAASDMVALAATSIGASTGQSLPHENQQPYQVINYIIALEGIFPTQN